MAIRIGTDRDGNPVKNYFKVWKITDQNGFIKAQCSTGRKKSKGSEEWINSSWNLKFVGNCKDKATQIREGDKLIVSECQIENAPDANKKYWLNVTVFGFEIDGQKEDFEVVHVHFSKTDDEDLESSLPF